MTPPRVQLVTADGRPAGVADRGAAHQAPGLLHVAVSVVVHDGAGRALVQQRSHHKRLFTLAWANSCCTHAEPGELAPEQVMARARRRLNEELGIDADLAVAGRFIYRAVDPASGLVEHELDTVLVGRAEREVAPDPREVAAIRWLPWEDLVGAGPETTWAPWAAEVHRLARDRVG